MPWWNPFDNSEEEEIRSLVPRFPLVFEKAVEDWAKFKAGTAARLFTASQHREIIAWFADFPRLWDTIKPNFEVVNQAVVPGGPGLYGQVERFVKKLRANVEIKNALGIAPLIVAGILIAGLFGVAGAVWAIGYVRKQGNISKMIDGVVAGQIPATVLREAVKVEKQSIFGRVESMLQYAVIGGAAVLAWPFLKKLTKKI